MRIQQENSNLMIWALDVSLIFVDKSLGNWLIRIYSPVTQKRPVSPVTVCFVRVNFMDHYFFLVVGSLV